MIVGIDPGLTGAIALLDGEECIKVWDMPVSAKTHGKGREVNPYLLVDLLYEADTLACADGSPISTVWIERVASMPGQGVAGVFSLGNSVGVLAGALAGVGARVEYVTPQRWKKHQGLIKKDKEDSRQMAIQRWPEMRGELKLKKHDGRAESILIADYGRTA